MRIVGDLMQLCCVIPGIYSALSYFGQYVVYNSFVYYT